MWLDDPNVILHPDGNGHPEIELIRSTHFNDLITIIPFLLLIILWQSTSPNYLIASNIIRGFALCKIFDTILRMKLINAPSIISVIIQIIYSGILIYVGIDTFWFYLFN